jgi:hypothetical protein
MLFSPCSIRGFSTKTNEIKYLVQGLFGQIISQVLADSFPSTVKGRRLTRPQWDVRRLLNALGGVQAFADECARRGWDIRPYTVQKWHERGSIPAHGIAAALLVLGSRRRPIMKFITTDDGQGRGTPAD